MFEAVFYFNKEDAIAIRQNIACFRLGWKTNKNRLGEVKKREGD